MSRTPCISHPAKDSLIQIRAWQVAFCQGDHCAAALLSFFEYWHGIRLAQSEKSRQANATAEKHGDAGTQDTSLWQYHTTEQLEAGLLGLYAATKIRTARKLLVELGAIEEGRNPNPRYSFDATVHFLFNPDVCQAWINTEYVPMDSSEITNPSRENNERADRNGGRATENNVSSINGDYTRDYLQENTGASAPPAHSQKKSAVVSEDVQRVFSEYRERIQPNARVLPEPQIKARLKTFTVDEISQAIQHFAADAWKMEHNADKGGKWFFETDGRIEAYLNLKPKKPGQNGNGKAPAPYADVDFSQYVEAANKAQAALDTSPEMLARVEAFLAEAQA